MKAVTCKACGHTKYLEEAKECDIVSIVADYYKIPVAKILGHDRHSEIALARHVAMYLMRRKKKTYPSIGKIFNRHHSTAIHSFSTVGDLMFSDPRVKADVSNLNKIISLSS